MLTPLIQSFHSALSPWKVYQTVYAQAGPSFFLDSIQYKSPDQAYSYIGFNPRLTLTLSGRRISVRGEVRGHYPAADLFKILRKYLAYFRCPASSRRAFFTGGAVGFWGYELAPLMDRIQLRAKPRAGTPKLFLGFFQDLLVYDHAKKIYYLVTHYRLGKRSAAKKKIDEMKNFFRKNPEAEAGAFHFKKFKPGITKNRFEAMVRCARRYIESGDIYQANLSQRFSFDFQGSPLRLYDALRKINPSPFASFLNLGDLKIISSSPERLVSKKGRICETKPIAGTHPRHAKPAELRSNAKERAEHIMLVDLERNDLGRVCEFESVKVEELMKIEKYSHVMHLVSKITGKLKNNKDGLDLLKAVFPGGTITGCPKIRCMEIINELEPVERGIYTGSIGYLDFYGDLDLNIVIRTLILQKNKGYFQVGAGIVYDSNPTREYEETLHKGEALAQALVQASL